ncbi:hypothetical protein D1614_05920 [Maribellus luteus]|uniref:Uncharacterized protein n=1 Tax=Maribellus luteus TaxID=2305463 RepID=A0A399SYA5_9BACT|nr:hypothetical protein [Maribellus luteus]RIJ49100.1 hypothetical protein D1614_05920 [Maribellus luteus]
MKKTPLLSGIIFILFGTVAWLIGNSIDVADYPNIKSFVTGLGYTIIGLGIISSLIDMPDWRSYFGERLKEIVLDRKYLENLSDKELIGVQRDILKSRYKETGIDKEGSFLNFMQESIEHLINSPFREHIACNCHITEVKDRPGVLYYKEKMSYTLKTVGDKKIENVIWTWRKDEMLEAKKMKCTFKCPKYKEDRSSCTCSEGKRCEDGFKEVGEIKIKDFGKDAQGYNIDIKEFMEPIDGVQVFVELEFTMSENKLYSWTMAYPSRDINLTLIYPESYEVDRYVGGLDEKDYYISTDFHENTVHFVREGWMLPTSGITFALSKKNSTQAVISNDGKTAVIETENNK